MTFLRCPLAHEFPNFTPYNFVIGNPVILVDPNGQKIDVSEMDGKARKELISDLMLITGLKVEVGDDGYLSYETNSNESGTFSQTARTLLIQAIDDKKEDNLVTTMENSGSRATDNIEPGLASINLNEDQINGYINNSENVNDKTLGYGMVFLHELNHTESGNDLSDNTSPGNPTGDNVDMMNIIRNEMGSDWGERTSYKRINGFMPFDTNTLDQLTDPSLIMDKNSRFIAPPNLLNEVIIGN